MRPVGAGTNCGLQFLPLLREALQVGQAGKLQMTGKTWSQEPRVCACIFQRIFYDCERCHRELVEECEKGDSLVSVQACQWEGQHCSAVLSDPLCPPTHASIPLSLHPRRRQHYLPHVSSLSCPVSQTPGQSKPPAPQLDVKLSCTFSIPEAEVRWLTSAHLTPILFPPQPALCSPG